MGEEKLEKRGRRPWVPSPLVGGIITLIQHESNHSSEIDIAPDMIEAGAAVLTEYLESRDDLETMPTVTQVRRLTTDVAVAMFEHAGQPLRKRASIDV